MKQRPGLAAWDYCVLVTAHTPDLLSLCCRAARARIRFGELCTGKRAVQHQVSISYTACRLALSASPEHPHPRLVRKTTRRLCVCGGGGGSPLLAIQRPGACAKSLHHTNAFGEVGRRQSGLWWIWGGGERWCMERAASVCVETSMRIVGQAVGLS